VTAEPSAVDVGGGDVGRQLHALVEQLYPINRSWTGDGVRETLALLRERIPLEVREVPSGTPVFDWQVPLEWNVREAWVSGPDGTRIADVERHSLHLVGYSVPISSRMTLRELEPHLHSIPERPDDIPYRTSYFGDTWGFCLPHGRRQRLAEGEYEVHVDSTLEAGSLTYGELFLPGCTEDEVLFTTHVCHPSMANDNCSGLAVASALAERLAAGHSRRHGYRFLFTPGTIGSLVWLSLNEGRLERLRAGIVLACLGDPGPLTWKRSRRGSSLVDRAVERVLADRGGEASVRDFVPYGYDERQFCSPGFDLPVGRLTRTPNGEYPEYHTSADDLDLVTPDALADSLAALLDVVDVLEREGVYRNLSPKGEPQLGRRGLYGNIGGMSREEGFELALLWVLNLSDGRASLLDVADRSSLPFATVAAAADALVAAGLLELQTQ
jgi:aminopeptidase-like protein